MAGDHRRQACCVIDQCQTRLTWPRLTREMRRATSLKSGCDWRRSGGALCATRHGRGASNRPAPHRLEAGARPSGSDVRYMHLEDSAFCALHGSRQVVHACERTNALMAGQRKKLLSYFIEINPLRNTSRGCTVVSNCFLMVSRCTRARIEEPTDAAVRGPTRSYTCTTVAS